MMTTWLVAAAFGAVLSLWGLTVLFRKYRDGDITPRFFLAIVVGYISFFAFVLVSAFRPDITTGLVTVVILLLAFIAIIVVIRERQSKS